MWKKGEIVDFEVTDLAFGGKGIGKIKTENGDFVVFVENVVPGDFVEARLTKIKKNYAEARLESITEPSKKRIASRCAHFGSCGGCALQSLNYEDQLRVKEKMVADALRQIGGFNEVKILPIIGCESPWFYRNKMEYSFGNDTRLGLHPSKNFREVFDLQECFLQSEKSVEILKAVREWARENGLTGFDARKNEGLLKNLIVREGKNTGEIMVNLVINGREFLFENDFKKIMCVKFPEITSLYRTAVTVQRGHKTLVEEFHLAGKKVLNEKLAVKNSGASITLNFEIAPQAFFQPNTRQAEILYGKILEFACLHSDAQSYSRRSATAAMATREQTAPSSADHVLDLFCGTGTIGLFFAKLGYSVTGVELNKSAIESARQNAETNGLKNIQFICGDILSFLPPDHLPLITNHSILITDPPRAGIAQKSLEKILELKIPKWIYVSCNPATLARDLKIACENGYKLEKIQPVDMFPQTWHVETVCMLKR